MTFLRVIISLLIIVTCPIVSYSAIGADPILNPDNGHYYQLIEVETGLNWNAAKVSAEAMEYNLRPGYLSTITSSQEQNFIVDNFPELLPNAVWIGAEDESWEGYFTWITGESSIWWIGGHGSYSNWDIGEPSGGTTQNCMDIAAGSVMWSDESCSSLRNYFLVEYSAPILETFDSFGSCGICSPEWSEETEIIGIKFEIFPTESTVPGLCVGFPDPYIFNFILTLEDASRYFIISSDNTPNFDDIVASLTDGNHCLLARQFPMVPDTTHGGCGTSYDLDTLTGANVGSIELIIGDDFDYYLFFDTGYNMWCISHHSPFILNIYEKLPKLVVTIDVKPGSYPNSINLKSKGKIPVAVLTTDDFNAVNVDPTTCVFASASPLRWIMKDVDSDGDQDLLFHFLTQEIDLNKDSIEATLEGKTFDGLEIIGSDTVNIVPKKAP